MRALLVPARPDEEPLRDELLEDDFPDLELRDDFELPDDLEDFEDLELFELLVADVGEADIVFLIFFTLFFFFFFF